MSVCVYLSMSVCVGGGGGCCVCARRKVGKEALKPSSKPSKFLPWKITSNYSYSHLVGYQREKIY